MHHAVARDKDNIPVMLDADGQGIILTNLTFAANIDRNGVIQNFEGDRPENITSVVFRNETGVYLDVDQGGNATTVLVYNSLFPQSGPEPTFNGTLGDNMKIGSSGRDYIKSESGMYRLGVIYQGSISGPLASLQVIPVLVVDSKEAGVYDTIIPDLSTAWADHTKFDLPAGEKPAYDFDFTDEDPIVLGGGNEFLVYDHNGDGTLDYSAGTVGARVLDVYGVTGGASEIHDIIQAINGTLLPPMDPDGEYFGIMTDFLGHGSSSAATVSSKGIQEYDIYNNTDKYTLKGVAPDAAILPVKALWFGDTVYASLWTAGFDSNGTKWTYSGEPRADIMSNSWGISSFPSIGEAPGLDLLSIIQSALATPRSLDPAYPGVLIVTSAGNSGHGYGTMGLPNSAPFAISVGATTNNVFVGYGPFKDQPRFGNTTVHANHLAGFSSRGPGPVGDPKPEIMSIGAHSFVPSQVTKIDKDTRAEPYTMFGGTSMAAPIVAGSAAIVMQALGDQLDPHTPFRVKNILVSTATDMNNDPFVQGAGLVNVDEAVRFVLGDRGSYIVHNDASYLNIKEILDGPIEALNQSTIGLDRFRLPYTDHPQTTWFGGHINPGSRSSTTFTIENPSDTPLDIHVEPQRIKMIKRDVYNGTTIMMQKDDILNGTDAYIPNYIPLEQIRQHPDLLSYFEEPEEIPKDASLLILGANFPFGEFMNMTDPLFANDIRISSLYMYDWVDNNTDGKVTSSELSLVNRGGSWGTVQEVRISDPNEQFEGVPLVGVYPVPARYSYWIGEMPLNSTTMDYQLSASYYTREKWSDVWLERTDVTIPAGGTVEVKATIIVPWGYSPGTYQGFINFSSEDKQASIPVTYGVKAPIGYDSVVFVEGKADDDVMHGNGRIMGAFDMINRYMAGDWRQYYFDITDERINAGILDITWENPDTDLSIFAIDPRGRLVHSNAPPGAFGPFIGWPTSNWLGPTPFSQGGGFYPVQNKDLVSSGLYVPINQTGTYTVLVHSGLFGGNSTTEGITISAKFTSIPQPDKEAPSGMSSMAPPPDLHAP
ncbi:surface layer-associated STABLE protease [Cenarchaeum symbiosum A]|uniref:Surface layer-associated STABLE protease n=1 Tax=Cenarchaeum symbiosum (strain A) TaxID=414004 RepID=A0RZA2_CENSY|nr:surface layer-associated STABLE protease [Cenarchaeum symbiosum A]